MRARKGIIAAMPVPVRQPQFGEAGIDPFEEQFNPTEHHRLPRRTYLIKFVYLIK